MFESQINIEALRSTILFRGMTDEEIKKSLKQGIIKKYHKNQLLLRAGGTTDSIGLVLSGGVTIESNDIWGNRTILSHVGCGDFFAETYALLSGEPLLVDVRANEASEILFFNIGNVLKENKESWQGKLIRNLLMISSRKNLMLSRRSFHTSPKSVRARVQAYLNSVSLETGSHDFDIPFDRQQMADYLNLDRTALSKELSRMKKDGIIDFWKNHFRIMEHSGEES